MYHLLAFNSTKTLRSIYTCIFYFGDNSIADPKESSKLFFFILFGFWQYVIGPYQNSSKPIYNNLCLLYFLARIDEVNTGQFHQGSTQLRNNIYIEEYPA